ncbi:gas vesicle protein GvpK [Aquimarina agarilytica]|uniref:gas vesicle protein GvpK n=1 Tax=Aquimarina agarilytica TaxID=1087449 RepID=UPI000287FCB9|nr:gas vesicle protein GvpK [Aquimarina agarilytica]
MKLIFNKEENNDITVKIEQELIPVEFTYTEMIKQLLENNSIDDTDFGNLSENEKSNLGDMLSKISNIFDEEELIENDDLEEINKE